MLNDNEKARLVYELLGKIKNHNHRSALLLQMQGRSLVEIKEILLNDSVENIKTYIHRAKQDLREIIRKEKT